MSNLTKDTGKPRFLKLLFVVLMMSVGLNLLLGCGKSNKGQVVGPNPVCDKKDGCEDDKKPFSGELWETAMGVVNYPGYGLEPGMYIKLGLDLYASSSAGSQAIVPSPKSGQVQAEGALFVDQLQLFCGYEWQQQGWLWTQVPKFETMPTGEYRIVKNLASGIATNDGFKGNKFELKKGDAKLIIEMGAQQFLPSGGFNIKDPAGNSYDFYLFGEISISNANGCVAYPWLSSGNSGYVPWYF